MEIYLISKYYLAFLFKKYFLKSKPFKINNFDKKPKIIICGNGPSLKDYEQSDAKSLTECDHLLINLGIIYSKIKPKIHVFELSRNSEIQIQQIKFLNNQKCFPDLTIFRPSRKRKNLLHLKYKHLVFFDELRIRYHKDKYLFQDLKKIKSNKILFARNSVIYSVILAIKLGYKNIEFIGINPENRNSFYKSINNENHSGLKGEFGITPIELLIKIVKFFSARGIKFSVNEYNGYNFLK